RVWCAGDRGGLGGAATRAACLRLQVVGEDPRGCEAWPYASRRHFHHIAHPRTCGKNVPAWHFSRPKRCLGQAPGNHAVRRCEMGMTDHEVVIAGGGPTGLMLRSELTPAGVEVALRERRDRQELAVAREGGLQARSTEVLVHP